MERVRQQVEMQLRSPITDEEWGLLCNWGNAGEIEQMLAGDVGLADAVEVAANRLRDMRRVYGEPAARMRANESGDTPAFRPAKAHHHSLAVSQLFAEEASRDPSVVEFRQDVLGGKLLARLEVKEWIQGQAAKAPSLAVLLTFPLPPGTEGTESETGVCISPALTLEQVPGGRLSRSDNRLWFMPDYSSCRESVGVGPDGILGRLQQVSTMLAERYGWPDASATDFVLTGFMPYISDVRTSYKHDHERPALSRVTLIVDPTVSPKRLLGVYSRIRRRLLGPRHRPLAKKSLLLAVSALEGRNRGLSWAEIMEEWNDRTVPHLGWRRYGEVSNLTRDALRAVKLLRDPWIDPGNNSDEEI